MRIEVKKITEGARLPVKAHDSDAGFDFYAKTAESKNKYVEYGTGVAVNIPKGYVGLMFPRSSISNKALMLSNSVGVIDSGYQGEIKFRFYHSKNSSLYASGERIGQLVVIPIPKIELVEAKEFSNTTERGTGAFGSTGQK